jgi:hypothetical protein
VVFLDSWDFVVASLTINGAFLFIFLEIDVVFDHNAVVERAAVTAFRGNILASLMLRAGRNGGSVFVDRSNDFGGRWMRSACRIASISQNKHRDAPSNSREANDNQTGQIGSTARIWQNVLLVDVLL